MGRSSRKETGTELGCNNIEQSGLRAEAEVFVPDLQAHRTWSCNKPANEQNFIIIINKETITNVNYM